MKVFKESCIYIILIIIIFSMKFAVIDWESYVKWREIIDNTILLILLIFMLINSKDWNWFSKRILYSLLFMLLLNTYVTLFGMNLNSYLHWYIIPLLSLVYTMTITSIIKILLKLYSLWKDGKIKLY